MTDSCKEIFGSSHHSVFTWKIALRTVLWVREFEPSLFEPGVYFNIKCIGKLLGPTNEFEQSLVFETGEFERPKFDCSSKFLLFLLGPRLSNYRQKFNFPKIALNCGEPLLLMSGAHIFTKKYFLSTILDSTNVHYFCKGSACRITA